MPAQKSKTLSKLKSPSVKIPSKGLQAINSVEYYIIPKSQTQLVGNVIILPFEGINYQTMDFATSHKKGIIKNKNRKKTFPNSVVVVVGATAKGVHTPIPEGIATPPPKTYYITPLPTNQQGTEISGGTNATIIPASVS